MSSALTNPKDGQTKGCVRGCGSEEAALPKLLLREGSADQGMTLSGGP